MTFPEQQKRILADICARADDALANNLMPFWADHAPDRQYGGFLTRLDRRGKRLDDSEKILIHQVRMIAALSMAHLHGLTDRGYLDLAEQGFEFVTTHMWDHDNGGFYFSVTRDGAPLLRRKNTDFHAYALIGLCEFYRATHRADVLEWAERVYDVLVARASDGAYGFVEDFDGAPWAALNDAQMGLGGRTGIKTIDMHTNMLEGLTYLARCTGRETHRQTLHSVLNLIVARGLDTYGGTITAFDREWNPIPDGHGRMTTSYGLNVELAWLILEAVDVLGLSRETYRDAVLGLVNHALEFGFDEERGGIAALGPMRGHVIDADELGPERLAKTWWAQAELLNALVDLFLWTREERYLAALSATFDWIYCYQIDHECGDWFQETDWHTGRPLTLDKGGEWKTAFHAARALIRLSNSLRANDI